VVSENCYSFSLAGFCQHFDGKVFTIFTSALKRGRRFLRYVGNRRHDGTASAHMAET